MPIGHSAYMSIKQHQHVIDTMLDQGSGSVYLLTICGVDKVIILENPEQILQKVLTSAFQRESIST